MFPFALGKSLGASGWRRNALTFARLPPPVGIAGNNQAAVLILVMIFGN